MNILFMGTPDIAAAALEAILDAGHTVCGVYTRADKPVGRKQVLTAPPVKRTAMAHGIPVFQPGTLRDAAQAENIRALAPELIVVVAYGRILPPEVLAIPQYGCINLHVSLLPRYRGAAPVQWAVINGEKTTGVSIMYLNEGLDTGDILRVSPVEIGENETSGELFERITQEGARTLLAAMEDIAAGTAQARPQNDAEATLAPPLTKEQAHFGFDAPARRLHDLIRGLNPWPVAYFEYGGKKVKVLRTLCDDAAAGAPGEILSTKPLKVACASGALTLLEVVPEGSRPMEGSAWAAGRRFTNGDKLQYISCFCRIKARKKKICPGKKLEKGVATAPAGACRSATALKARLLARRRPFFIQNNPAPCAANRACPVRKRLCGHTAKPANCNKFPAFAVYRKRHARSARAA